jgi:hypothetical protein
MALTDPWSGEDDDAGYDYYDTPSGNIWRPGDQPRAAPRRRTRAAGPLPGRSSSPSPCAAPGGPVPAWPPAGAAGRRTGPPRRPGPAAAGRTGDDSPPAGIAGRRPAGDRHSSGMPGGLAVTGTGRLLPAPMIVMAPVRPRGDSPAVLTRGRTG